ncbi:hypothetical protein P152DRAFT_476606 [Eremomyces bilateralis CBS 781.70]|uniref:Uncharacterized protein n=1 Tax=Eremomyces bilateralis CBS 781.70 TaxID=1392243 RepID=A0A6G1FTP5_9PEZI|nr:uncharacterized protein P152DRAFT_476606 [Eremomyces bilateralis CBS 781.70]KAF1809255.1 hypothetical protein P152DRAFT_476606 [Eremomyces bilateralis CBS 781.70]
MQPSIPQGQDSKRPAQARPRATSVGTIEPKPSTHSPKKHGPRPPKNRNPQSNKKQHAPPVWEDAINRDEIGDFGPDGQFIDSSTATNNAATHGRPANNKPPKKYGKRKDPAAWQDTQVTKEETGYFSADGRYIDPSAHATEQAAVSDSAAMAPNPRKKPIKHVNGQSSIDLSSPSKGAGPADPKKKPLFTPAKAQAYAGPGFHASPAASALPIPKFFSKSVPNGGQNGLQSRLDSETEQAEAEAPMETIEIPIAGPANPGKAVPSEESPLDFFFNAARKERANGRSVSGLPTPTSTEPLARQSEPPKNHYAAIYGGNLRNHARHASHGSNNKEMFMMELDGANTAVDSPSRPAPQPKPHNNSVRSIPPIPYPRAKYSGSPSHELPARNPSPLASPPPSVSHGLPTRAPEQPPFYRGTPHLPRSASGPSTPSPSTTPQNPQLPPNGSSPYHYGNRNLSPLFKAAAAPGPTSPPTNSKRTSLLRNVALPTVDHSPSRPSRPAAPDRRSDDEIRRISTQYLEQQCNRDAPDMPPIDLAAVARKEPIELGESSPTKAQGEGTRDIRRLEESLRKMLDLKK